MESARKKIKMECEKVFTCKEEDKVFTCKEEAWYHYHRTKEEMLSDRYLSTKIDEMSQELPCEINNRQKLELIYNIIVEFFLYWSDDAVETRAIDRVTQLLIKHSRNLKQDNDNFLAVTMYSLETVHRLDRLNLETLLEIINDFITNVRREKCDNLFDWNCLIIVFTVAHELSMKYPHMYLDLIDMLCEVFYLAGDDLTALGGWNDFKNYSTQLFM